MSVCDINPSPLYKDTPHNRLSVPLFILLTLLNLFLIAAPSEGAEGTDVIEEQSTSQPTELPHSSLPAESIDTPSPSIPPDIHDGSLPEQPTPGSEPERDTLAPPKTAQEETIHNQIALLVVEDVSHNRLYVTSLNNSGQKVSGAAPPSIFGVIGQGESYHSPVAWHPHFGVNDVKRFTVAFPNEAFSGVLNPQKNQLNGDITTLELPASDFTGLLFSDSVLESLRSPNLEQRALHLQETLVTGEERDIHTNIEKQAHITLRRPTRLTCRDNEVKGKQGKSCIIREVQITGSLSQGGDIQFLIRGSLNVVEAFFRVNHEWHALGTSIPVAEFNQSQTIELFIPDLSDNMLETLAKKLELSEHAALLQLGFYSASRHHRGDRFAVKLGERLPSGEERLLMSRLEILTIEDWVTKTHYVTTLGSSAGQQKKPPVLFGVDSPGMGEKPATWYSKGVEWQPPPQSSSEYHVQLNPQALFREQNITTQTLFSPELSEHGWQKLLSMSAGESQQWRLTGLQAGRQQYLFAHLVKAGQLRLESADKEACQEDIVEGRTGVLCTLRKTFWQGPPVTGDIRFALSSDKSAAESMYRVGKRWVKGGNSVPLSEFMEGDRIDVFFIPLSEQSSLSLTQESTGQLLSSAVQMKFFSAARMGKGDRYSLRIPLQTHSPLSSQSAESTQTVQNNGLEIIQLHSKQKQIQAGENFHASLTLNRPSAHGESLLVRLLREGDTNSPSDEVLHATLNSQPQAIRAGVWQEIQLDDNTEKINFKLSTSKRDTTSTLKLQVKLSSTSMLPSHHPQLRSTLASATPTSTEIKQTEVQVLGISPRMASNVLLISSNQDGIEGKYSPQVELSLPLLEAPTPNQGGIILLKCVKTSACTLSEGSIEFFSSDNTSTGQSHWKAGGEEIMIPSKTTKVILKVSPPEMSSSQITETELNAHFLLGDGILYEGRFTLRMLGRDFKQYVQIQDIKLTPPYPLPSEEATLTILSENVPSGSRDYYLSCTKSNDEVLLNNKYDVWYNGNKYKTGYFGADENTGILREMVLNGFQIRVPIRAGASEKSQVILRCKIDYSDNLRLGRYFSTYIHVGNIYRFKEAKINSGVEEASMTVTTVETPKEDQILYYQVEPIGFTAQEKAQLKIGIRNDAVANSKELPGQLQGGTITVPKGETWSPTLISRVPALAEHRDIKFHLALLNRDFTAPNGRYTQTATAQMRSFPLTFDIEKQGGNRAGEPLILTLSHFNRPPRNGEALLFELTEKNNSPPLSELFELSQAQLLSEGPQGTYSERIDLSQQGEMSLSLNHAAEKGIHRLVLTIPGKLPSLYFEGKEYGININWHDRLGQPGNFPKKLTGSLPAFEQSLSIDVSAEGDTTFHGEVEKAGLIRHDFVLSWQRGPNLKENQSVKEHLQLRAIQNLPALTTLSVRGQPVIGLPSGQDPALYCALDLRHDDQQRQVAIPAFISYLSKSQRYTSPVGCGRIHIFQDPDWRVAQSVDRYSGSLPFQFGFDYSDPVLKYTLNKKEAPSTEWVGTAEGILTLEIQFNLNSVR